MSEDIQLRRMKGLRAELRYGGRKSEHWLLYVCVGEGVPQTAGLMRYQEGEVTVPTQT